MKYAVFGFTTKNLGDDVQSLAAALLLPRIDSYVDRDRLCSVRLREPHLVIMNSWFAKRHDAVPSSSLAPIYFGYCIGRPELLNDVWFSEWKCRAAPIGCRDRYSVRKLQDAGIDAHFTGCLTTLMGRFFSPPAKREGVLFIDVPEPIERLIPSEIRERARRLSNRTMNRNRSQSERYREIAQVLDAVRSAELVVTRRLHAALPCVGFGTPVTVYLEDIPQNRRRFSGPDEFLPIVFHDGIGPIDAPGWKEPVIPEIPAEIDDRFQALCEMLGCSATSRWNSVAEFAETLPDVRREPRGILRRLMNA